VQLLIIYVVVVVARGEENFKKLMSRFHGPIPEKERLDFNPSQRELLLLALHLSALHILQL
jgi:hypothetical protein